MKPKLQVKQKAPKPKRTPRRKAARVNALLARWSGCLKTLIFGRPPQLLAEPPMHLFVGLGNPGGEYALHRHNIGFMAADTIAEMHGFSPWTKKFQGLVADGRIGTERVLLLKPQTFMNESGRSIGEAMRFYKLGPQDVTVFYDELDLAPMKVKVKTGGGAAGHNGIRSTIAHIGEDFRRVRLGIGHPGAKPRVTGYVLGNFAKAEIDPLADLLNAVGNEAHWLAEGNEARFMSEVALRMQDSGK